MNLDIDSALEAWDFKPGMAQARLIRAHDGRQVIQMRIDLGILQMETTGRPDGSRPHGSLSYFDYLRQLARVAKQGRREFKLNEEQCEEADREFVQYYHRRICWLGLSEYDKAIADADHTLAFMNFVRDHTPGEEYTQAHEQYRGFVIFHRTQAAAAMADERKDPEGALNALQEGLGQMRAFFAEHGAEEQMDEDRMVRHLRKLDRDIRGRHKIEATLQEQLDEAVAKEQYETAARIRDAMRRRRP